MTDDGHWKKEANHRAMWGALWLGLGIIIAVVIVSGFAN